MNCRRHGSRLGNHACFTQQFTQAFPGPKRYPMEMFVTDVQFRANLFLGLFAQVKAFQQLAITINMQLADKAPDQARQLVTHQVVLRIVVDFDLVVERLGAILTTAMLLAVVRAHREHDAGAQVGWKGRWIAKALAAQSADRGLHHFLRHVFTIGIERSRLATHHGKYARSEHAREFSFRAMVARRDASGQQSQWRPVFSRKFR